MSTNFALLIEDNPDEVVIAERAFKRAGLMIELAVARDGQEALDYLFCLGKHASRKPHEKPALILLDLNLPLVGGFEVLRKVRACPTTRGIPVVVLTSSSAENDEAESYRLGADEFIHKPIGFSDFVDIVAGLKSRWLAAQPDFRN